MDQHMIATYFQGTYKMKKYLLALSLLCISCSSNISIESNSSFISENSLLSSEEIKYLNESEISSFINQLDTMDGNINKIEVTNSTDNQLISHSEYTSTKYKNNIIISKGISTYEDSTFSFEIQLYETDTDIVQIWYYGPHDSSNYSLINSKNDYTSEQLISIFELGEGKYFKSMLLQILNDTNYTDSKNSIYTSHIHNKNITISKINNDYTLDCFYECQTTITEDGASASEVLNYKYQLKFHDGIITSSYEEIVGAQFLDDHQYNYASKTTSIIYHQGELESFDGNLFTPSDL